MTPLVIGLPAVVAVIVLAVVIGLHLIKKNERARLGDPSPSKDRPAKADRGQADDRKGGGGNEPWREPARPRRPDQVPAAVAAVGAAPRPPAPEQQALAEQHRSPPAGERRPADGPPVEPGDQPRPDASQDGPPPLAAAENLSEQRRSPPADAGPGHAPPAGAGPGPRPDRPVRPPNGPHDLDQEVVRLKPRLSKSQGKAKRSGDDEDWPSTDWDDLSDADYWKEVASDKPLVTRTPEGRPDVEDPARGPASSRRPARPAPEPQTVIQQRPPRPAPELQTMAQQRPPRPGPEAQTVIQQRPDLRHLAAAAAGPGAQEPPRGDRDPHHRGAEPRRPAADGRRGPDQRPMGAPPREPAPLPARNLPQRAAAGGYAPEFLGAPPAPPAPSAMASPARPAAAPMPQARPVAPPVPQSRPLPQPLDEDPLTSPSFPRITEDSRSFRASRARAAAPVSDSGAYSSDSGAYSTVEFPGYGAPAGERPSDPVGYAAASVLPAPAAAAAYPLPSAAPAGYPGGAPVTGSGAYPSTGYSGGHGRHDDGSGLHVGPDSHLGPNGRISPNGHNATTGHAANGHPVANGHSGAHSYGGNGHSGAYPVPNGSVPNGYGSPSGHSGAHARPDGLGTAGVPGGGAGYADGYSSHSGGYPIPAGPGTASGRGSNGHGGAASSGNGHHDGHSGGYSHEELGIAPPPPAPSFPSTSAPAGNPYGSYVNEDTGSYISTDLPGYTPSLASGYLPASAPGSGRHRPVPAPPAPTPPAGGAYGNGYSIPPGQLPAGYTGKHKGQGGQGLPGYDRLGPLPGYPADGSAAGLPDPQGCWPPDPYQERGWDGHGGR
jgi:hypothetical protein